MSPLATLCAAFTAVYAYLCAYYSLLYVRRRAEREYLAFGLLSGAMAVYALGAGLYVDAGSLHKAIHASELTLYGQLTAAALYVDFAHHISAKAGQRMPRFAYALSFVGGLGNLAGLLIDSSQGSAGWCCWRPAPRLSRCSPAWAACFAAPCSASSPTAPS
jgi:hypothetical protein